MDDKTIKVKDLIVGISTVFIFMILVSYAREDDQVSESEYDQSFSFSIESQDLPP